VGRLPVPIWARNFRVLAQAYGLETMQSAMPDVEQIEQDLAQLARHRLGFQHPDALTELHHLLSLLVVEHAAGDNADLPEGRVLALRSVLQTVIARVRNATSRRALEIYFFLDPERQELRSSTLSARRTEIVRRLPFHDEQWRRGLEDRFRAILAGELHSYELEHRLTTHSTVPPGTVPVKLVRTSAEVRAQLHRIVEETRECLLCVGSRSREANYLDRIIAKLTHETRIAHCRVLWGEPHHEVMIPHLLRLLSLQSLRQSQDGAGGIRIGLFRDWRLEPERFIVANEHDALMVLAPRQVGTFDTAAIFRNDETVAYVKDYVADLYNCSQRVTLDVVQDLKPLRSLTP
jgi:hypothetical protein